MLASTPIHLSVFRTQSMEICFKTDKHVTAPKQKNKTKTVSLRCVMSSCLPSEGLRHMFQVCAAVKDTGLGCQNYHKDGEISEDCNLNSLKTCMSPRIV